MAVIVQSGHQEKPVSEIRQIIINSVLQILSAECIRTVNRILSDIERQPGFDFEAAEFCIRDEMHRAGALIFEQILKYAGGTTEKPVCECGGTFRNKKKRSKILLTVLGEVTAERDIVRCDRCGRWTAVRDRAWDTERTGLSPGVRKILSEAGAALSFEEGAEFIRKLSGLKVTVKAVERVSESIGGDMQRQEDEAVREVMRGGETESEAGAEKLYIACDGTGVPVLKRETEGRRGKGEDGEAKTREVKLGCVFTQTGVNSDGEPVRDPYSSTYVGRIESADDFGPRLYAEAVRRGIEKAGQVICIGDGAPWIWNIAAQHFPNAVRIVDFYHAREHLETLGKKIYPDDRTAREVFSRETVGKLRQGKISEVIIKLNSMDLKGNLKKERDREVKYFEKNQNRMRYNEFRKAGLFIGSGVVEAGCKSVIAQRLKQSGMRWSVRGADSIISLRCRIKSGRFEDYWEDRRAA
jgi:hypothetical protein